MFNSTKGSTIIESIVAISIFSLFIFIFASSYTLINTGQYLKHKNLAYYLALEEIELLRQAPFTNLTNQVDSPFMGTAYNNGNWIVTSHTSAPSSPNVYQLSSPLGNPSGLTGLAVIPGFEYNNFILQSELLIDTDSPTGWESGLFFRYSDAKNFYYVGINTNELVLKKVVDGVETELGSSTDIYSKNNWYTIKVTANNDSIIVHMDDVEKINITDDEFSGGRLALVGYNSSHSYFDDVSITTSSAVTWNFDSDDISGIAEAWQRFGINDLPNGETKLTIEDDQPGYTSIKKITAKVEWQEKNNLRAVEIITLINQ